MSFFSILKFRLKHANYSQIKSAHFVTEHVKFATKKFTSRKNNFLYKNEFQCAINSESSPTNVKFTEKTSVKSRGNRDVWTSKVSPVKPRPSNNSSSINKKMSSLQYKGEILYGIHPVYLALLQRKRNIFQLFLRTIDENSSECGNIVRKREIEEMARKQGIKISTVDSRGMNYLAPGVVHQKYFFSMLGVCLDTSPLQLPVWQDTDSVTETHDSAAPFPLWLILDEILDPMNVGAIIRSAYYFGIQELFIIRGNSCKLSPTVSKASSGALEVINIYQIEKLAAFIQIKKSQGWNIISTIAYCEDKSTTLGPVVDVTDIKIDKPTILILGNEGKGISNEIQQLCNSFVTISPLKTLHKGIDSLNVSVATGVILQSLSTKMKALT